MTIIFFSGNLHKAREISAIFADAEVRIYTDFMEKFEVAENGASFAQNAKIKLNALKNAIESRGFEAVFGSEMKRENVILMAEDSGICVESLDNLPNIFSARFANLPKNFIDSPSLASGDSKLPPSLAEGARGWVDSIDSENIARLISELKARNLSKSKAQFVSCVACCVANLKDSSLQKNNLPIPYGGIIFQLSPSLAEGDKGGGLKAQKNSSAKFANNNSTHPLAPSAREGGHNVKSSAISQKAEFAEIAKVFNVKDGLAIAYWRKVLKRKVAIITGKSSEILRVRANELQIPSDLLFMNVRDKGKIVRELKQRFALKSARIAAVGDDLNDISMFAESSLNFAPNDCATALKSLKNLTILNAKGGEGAVRESIEAILQKEKLYEKFIQYWQ